jgi:hypothetical protein
MGEVLMPAKIIVGLHGLSNKPPEATLKDWWWKSITDGVYSYRCGQGSPETDQEREAILPKEDFIIIYWADLMYAHSSYVYTSTQPYIRINQKPPSYEPKWFDGPRKWLTAWAISLWDRGRRRFGGFGYTRLVNVFLKEKYQDLYAYWNQRLRKRFVYWENDQWHEEEREITDDEMREGLASVLRDHMDTEDQVEILVIAHSMGTIIAYDTIGDHTLTELNGHPLSLITIGSPLGLPTVRSHLAKPSGSRRPVFPETRVKEWYNFADPGDLIAAVPRLSPHFKDSQGRTRIRDSLVQNDFRDKGGSTNPHKSFGYLRCPELAKVVDQFLTDP